MKKMSTNKSKINNERLDVKAETNNIEVNNIENEKDLDTSAKDDLLDEEFEGEEFSDVSFEKYLEENGEEDEVDMSDEEFSRFVTGIEKREDKLGVCGDALDMYLKDLKQYSLLSQEEEIELCKQIESGKFAEQVLSEGNLDADEKKFYEGLVATGKKAKDRMICSNLRLVYSIAKRFDYTNNRENKEVLIQEGNIGLMHAIDKFDYKKGYKFSTYATWWIRQAISRGMVETDRMIRVPVHMVELINKINRVKRRFAIENNCEPTIDDLVEILGEKRDKIEKALNATKDIKSLDASINDDGDSSLEDFVADINMSTDNIVSEKLLKEAINEALETLDERESLVLTLRFGLNNTEALTLEQVGKRLDVTRERVRQIEDKALTKLGRRSAIRNKLYDFYY